MMKLYRYFEGFVQERHNSSALAELRLICTNPSILKQGSFHTYNIKQSINMNDERRVTPSFYFGSHFGVIYVHFVR